MSETQYPTFEADRAALARPTWGVWCEVWGGVTGARAAWLKRDGGRAVFATR